MTTAIDQLWYTASPFGLSKSPGWQVRAASPGLNDPASPRMHRLIPLLRYELPVGARPTSITPADAPLTFAFFKLDDEHILVQRAFTGYTWDRRPGNYFSHLLAGLPAGFGAREAIDLWQASFWACKDTLTPYETLLQTLDSNDLEPGPLVDLQRFDHKLVEELELLITAFLGRRAEQRIYLIALPEIVATLIWGLTHTIPSGMLSNLTFSTFERQLSGPTVPLIVGSCPAPGQSDTTQLHAGIEPGSIVIDMFGKQVRGLPENAAAKTYAATATQMLMEGKKVLDLFFASVGDAAIQDVETLNAFLAYYAEPYPTRGSGAAGSQQQFFPLLEQFPDLILANLDRDPRCGHLVMAYLDQFSLANLSRPETHDLLVLLSARLPQHSLYYMKVRSWLDLDTFLRSPAITEKLSASLRYDFNNLSAQTREAIRPDLVSALVSAIKAVDHVREASRCLNQIYFVGSSDALDELFDAAIAQGIDAGGYTALCWMTRYLCTEIGSKGNVASDYQACQQILRQKIVLLDPYAIQAIEAERARWPGEIQHIWGVFYQYWNQHSAQKLQVGVFARLRSLFGPRKDDH